MEKKNVLRFFIIIKRMRVFLYVSTALMIINNIVVSQIIIGQSPKNISIGISSGISYAKFLVDYKAKCDYIFSSVDGNGFFINLVSIFPLDYYSDLYVSLGYQFNKLYSLPVEKYNLRSIIPDPTKPGIPNQEEILMESKLEVNLNYLNFYTYYKRIISGNLYGAVGVGLNMNLKNRMEQVESIKDDRFVFDVTNKTTDLVYKGDLPNSNPVLFSGCFVLGYDFYIKDKFIITPQVSLIYPFTRLTTTNALKVLTLNAGLQILYVL